MSEYDYQGTAPENHEPQPLAEAPPVVELTETAALTIEPSEPAPLTPMTPSEAGPALSDEQMQQLRAKLYWLLTVFPEQVEVFVGEYKQPLTIAAITVAAIPFVALGVAILEVINTIPLLAPTFELIGFGFSSWFVYRYLLFAKNRQEFVQNIDNYKEKILGSIDPPQA